MSVDRHRPSPASGDDVLDVVVVGGGPRAVSVVERLVARLGAGAGSHLVERGPVTVALVDRVDVGAGSTWRRDQDALLLNNTYAGHTTIWPDDSTPMTGPVVPGPDLMAWAAGPAPGGRPDWVAGELATLRPWSFPSRRLQGVYFREQLDDLVAGGRVVVREVLGTAVDVVATHRRDDDVREVRLADGTRLLARTVVLAQGMVQAGRSRSTRRRVAHAAAHGLVYLEPGMPSERDHDVVPAGEPAIVLGLGANFFDVLTLLTVGRGGRVEPLPDDAHAGAAGAVPRVRYRPSGAEPVLLVGSRRGLPYRSKAAYPTGFPPPYRPVLATRAWFERVAATPLQDFRTAVWPQLARELVWAHLSALLEHHPSAVRPGLDRDGLLARVAGTGVQDLGVLVAEVVADPLRRLDPQRLDRPDPSAGPPVEPDADGTLTEQDWQRWLTWWLADEHESLAHPDTSPRNAVNRAMAALRGPARALVGRGAVAGRSVVGDVHGWFEGLNLALASGPPPHRSVLLHALVRAGVVRLLGEGTSVHCEPGAFVATTAGVRRPPVRTRALVETRMSRGQVALPEDPLLRALLDTGRARLHRWPDQDGGSTTDTSLDLTRDRYRLVDAAGHPDEAVVVLGIPAGGLQPGSAIGATPGVPSPLIAGADLAAAQVLQRCRDAGHRRPHRPGQR